MSVSSATPLMIDTGALYARADSDDTHHETATDVFERIRSGGLPYRPLYTTQAVLAEAATLCRYKLGHDVAVRTLTAVRDSQSITVLLLSRIHSIPRPRSSLPTTIRRSRLSIIRRQCSLPTAISTTFWHSMTTSERSGSLLFRTTRSPRDVGIVTRIAAATGEILSLSKRRKDSNP
ncbi:type II toxin-antitoxin system VapC family toxin [Halonotius sp. GCM10025705]|uniref:type II toxin-antitoxin system VapC family toxin n=1 Tax=Halonotius sp. GCM10025705 TaxID=3252678 RepID=UPI003622347C